MEGSFTVVEEFLNSVGAESALPAFRQNAIDDGVLPLLTEDSLKTLGLPLGIQLRIWNGLQKRFHRAEEEEGKREGGKMTMRRRQQMVDEDEEEEEEEEDVEKSSKRKLIRKGRQQRMEPVDLDEPKLQPGFFKRWMPTFVIVAAFTPLMVYLVVEVVKDAIDGLTNFVFATMPFLIAGIVILLCSVGQSIWWAYLEGTSPVEYFGALCAEKPVLNF